MPDSVVIFHFPEKATAYEALSEVEGFRAVRVAAVAERDEQGRISVPEVRGIGSNAFWEGSLIGAVIGILGGPFGILLGWAAGALIGGTIAVQHEQDEEDGLGVLAHNIKPGENVLFVETEDDAPGLFDDLASRLGGSAVHIPAAEVQAEVDDARVATEEAVKAARAARRANRRTALREKVHHLFHPGD